FTSLLSNSLKEAPPGVMLTAYIQEAYRAGVEKLAATEGVKTVLSGDHPRGGCHAPAYLFTASANAFLNEKDLEEEVFGPSTLAVSVDNREQLLEAARKLRGHLTATLHATEKDLVEYRDLIDILEQKVGRLIINGYPTGVEVTHAMVHGGPFPA